MMKPLIGKKLLVLGATRDELSLVKRGQELGAYVIVTDIFDRYTSPSKCIADEAWDFSWQDVELLAKKCRENNIDGITAGYSEIKIDYLIRICEKLKLPCYANQKQLDITRDKIKFKQACRFYGIPTVKEYRSIDEVDEYPVIVKPVDRAGSIGVGIAQNPKELEEAYQEAKRLSLTQDVIIEKYMTGTKVDIYYSVENGVAKVLTTCDTVMSNKNGLERVVQNAWLYPHRNEEKLLQKCDAAFRKMICGMGIQYGCIFFSGFEDEKGNYTFFECGFRLEGGMQHEYAKRKGIMNYLDIFIFHALTGDTALIERGTKLHRDLKLCTINYYARKGKIGLINGFDEIEKNEQCTLSHVCAKVGDQCDDNDAILKKIGMFSIADENPEKLENMVREAQNLVDVRDDKGEDIIYDRLNPEIISAWWK